MAGAIIELVSKGVQDSYITGNPEVSFFRQKYKRHTNFAMKHSRITWQGAFTPGGEISFTIPRKGDLLNYVWIDTKYAPGDNPAGQPGFGPYNDGGAGCSFELYIGGQLVDRLSAWYNSVGWPAYMANTPAKPWGLADGRASNEAAVWPVQSQVVPLHFTFFDGTPLPLVALQYHEVEIRIRLNSDPDILTAAEPEIYAAYTVLDTDERRHFTENPIEMLIEQVQRVPMTLGDNINPAFDLSLLNHPVKCLILGTEVITDPQDGILFDTAQLRLNGTTLYDNEMPNSFFEFVQPYYHGGYLGYLRLVDCTPRLYSFALEPWAKFPTGSCNFSRLDTADLKITNWDGTNGCLGSNAILHGVNWNVLRIESGMAGVAFAN